MSNDHVSDHIPEAYHAHLLSGGKLVFTATPLDKEAETLVWAVDLEWMYEARSLPHGSWIGERTKKMPEGTTPESIFEAVVNTIGAMSKQVGGAILDIKIATPNKTMAN